MEHRTIEIKLYYLKCEENYSLFKTNGSQVAKPFSQHYIRRVHICVLILNDFTRRPFVEPQIIVFIHPSPDLFLLLFFFSSFFFKWKLKPVISFYPSHIVPAHHRHLNQYFLILGNKCSSQKQSGMLDYVLCECSYL